MVVTLETQVDGDSALLRASKGSGGLAPAVLSMLSDLLRKYGPSHLAFVLRSDADHGASPELAAVIGVGILYEK